jgi:hypothetical protein
MYKLLQFLDNGLGVSTVLTRTPFVPLQLSVAVGTVGATAAIEQKTVDLHQMQQLVSDCL